MSKKDDLTEAVRRILEEYPGMRLTLRQIYYRLVANQTIENNISQYKYLSSILVQARYSGDIDFHAIEDRTRSMIGGDHTLIPPEERVERLIDYIENFPETYNIPFWYGQDVYIEVWLEKRALQTEFERVTSQYMVRLAPCGGYPSHSFIYDASQEMPTDRRIHILYFGDHDPSGRDIERFIRETFERQGLDVNIERIALTPEQIEQYDLPPAPTKTTDSRRGRFVLEHGDACVELDALPPDVLRNLVATSIRRHIDMEAFHRRNEEQMRRRDIIRCLLAERLRELVSE